MITKFEKFENLNEEDEPIELVGFPSGDIIYVTEVELSKLQSQDFDISYDNNIDYEDEGGNFGEWRFLDKQKEKPLQESGFVFTGSIQVSAPEEQTGLTYAADACEPKSIVSLYNEPTTVLNV